MGKECAVEVEETIEMHDGKFKLQTNLCFTGL